MLEIGLFYKCFATDVAVVFGVLLAVNSLHMFVNISRAELLLTQLTLFSLGLWSQVPLNVVLEILYFVDSSIAEWAFESRHRVVDERVLPCISGLHLMKEDLREIVLNKFFLSR